MRVALPALLVMLVLAGCSSGGGPGDGSGNGGGAGNGTTSHAPVALPPGTGLLRGIVVDTAIRPVQNATVSVTGPSVNQTKVTGADGAFQVEALPPGTYVVAVSHLVYRSAQTTATVVAGDQNPPTVKVQLERLFSQDPYHETLKFDGFIQCGYSVSGAISSICVNDYTHFVGPNTCDFCEHLVDNRGTIFAVGAGWQTQIYEMVWDPSAQGTSPEMSLTVSFYPRVASHWYCQAGSAAPVLVRIESNVTCEQSQGSPQPFPPEGLNNTYMFAASKAPAGQPASFTWSQRFQVFTNIFYYGKPPQDWSFVRGDSYPF